MKIKYLKNLWNTVKDMLTEYQMQTLEKNNLKPNHLKFYLKELTKEQKINPKIVANNKKEKNKYELQ